MTGSPPPYILKALGDFDVDPCCPATMPWRTARVMIQQPEDGLATAWNGRVWLNPPYGPLTSRWIERLAAHDGGGTALIFARTETDFWQKHVWPRASAVLFLAGRLYFYDTAGAKALHNSGGPSALVAYGPGDAARLAEAGLPGALVTDIQMSLKRFRQPSLPLTA